MSEHITNVEKISEALQLLDEVAGEERSHFQEIFKNGYSHLKDAILATEQAVEGSLSQTRDKAYAAARQARDYSVDRVKFVDAHAHEKPWVYVAAAGIFGLLTGYIFGRNSGR